jgi:hypothetical protein
MANPLGDHTISWHDGESDGYTDILPFEWFKDEGSRLRVRHDVENMLNFPVENGDEIRPDLIRRTGGGWLAVAPDRALLSLGVTAATKEEASEKFCFVYQRWIEILEKKILDGPLNL